LKRDIDKKIRVKKRDEKIERDRVSRKKVRE